MHLYLFSQSITLLSIQWGSVVTLVYGLYLPFFVYDSVPDDMHTSTIWGILLCDEIIDSYEITFGDLLVSLDASEGMEHHCQLRGGIYLT